MYLYQLCQGWLGFVHLMLCAALQRVAKRLPLCPSLLWFGGRMFCPDASKMEWEGSDNAKGEKFMSGTGAVVMKCWVSGYHVGLPCLCCRMFLTFHTIFIYISL